MEPPKRGLRALPPSAQPGEFAEYQRLLAERFAVDPSLQRAPAAVDADRQREDRLRELAKKLGLLPREGVAH